MEVYSSKMEMAFASSGPDGGFVDLNFQKVGLEVRLLLSNSYSKSWRHL